MGAHEIIDALNHLCNFADSMDNTGVLGVKAMSNGESTTRESINLDLSQFLLYIANGNGSFTEAELNLINLVIGSEFTSDGLKQICATIDDPDPESLTLMAFLSCDKALNEQNGKIEMKSTSLLIDLFEAMGNLMVAFDENYVSETRVLKFINGMKSYAMKVLNITVVEESNDFIQKVVKENLFPSSSIRESAGGVNVNIETNNAIIKGPSRIMVCNDWSIEVPDKFIATKNTEIIGDHRYIAIVSDDNSIVLDGSSSIFDATENLSVHDAIDFNFTGFKNFMDPCSFAAVDSWVNEMSDGLGYDAFIAKRSKNIYVKYYLNENLSSARLKLFQVSVVTLKTRYLMQILLNSRGSLKEKTAKVKKWLETVEALGDNEYVECNTAELKDIVAVSAGERHTVGLKKDGTVVTVGNNDYWQCHTHEWKDIIAVSAGAYYTIGLKKDGTIVAVGDNDFGQCNTSGWKDIIAVSAGESHTVGLKKDGTVMAVGWNNEGQCNTSGWKDIIAVSTRNLHTVGLKKDGTVVAVGLNADGQCDTAEWKDIIAVSAGESHTVGLKKDGTVVVVGDDECDTAGWKGIIAVSAGVYHTVGLKKDGTVVAVGDNEFGQCDTAGWKGIIAVSAGNNHTVGLKRDGIVVAVGDNEFGQCDIDELNNNG